jgi:hypothetical protein
MHSCRSDSDPTEPVYILEIGSGHARLMFSIIQTLAHTHLDELLDIQVAALRRAGKTPVDRNAAKMLGIPVRFIISDFTEANVKWWYVRRPNRYSFDILCEYL